MSGTDAPAGFKPNNRRAGKPEAKFKQIVIAARGKQ